MKLLTLVFIAILACGTSVSAKDPETVRVRVGQTRSVDRRKLSIKFISIVEDSRCPINARCIWAGNAKIKLAVSKRKAGAKTFEIELNTGLKPDTLTVFGYEIKFVDLSPHPGETNATPALATLSIKKIC